MRFWKSPFNKIVRSKEAMIIGLLLGLVIGGTAEGFLMPSVVKGEAYNNPIELCDTVENIDKVTIRFDGKITKVECNDGRDFKL